MKRNGVLIFAYLAIATTGCHSAEVPSRATQEPTTVKAASGERSLDAESGDYKATLTLTTQPRTVRFGGPWGATGTNDEIATDLTVYYKAKEVAVWRSSFSDLANARELRITSEGKGATLEITGGDAHGSYRCSIRFEGPYMMRRRVESGEFPDNFFETTEYTDIDPGI